MAAKHNGHGRSLLDLIQDGNLGLLRAVDKFDWRYGTKFSRTQSGGFGRAFSAALAST